MKPFVRGSLLSCTVCFGALTLGVLSVASANTAESGYVETRVLTLESAQKIANAAAKHCQKDGHQVAVAVVDRQGVLIAFVRDPLAGAHTVDVAIAKAYTSASTKTPTLAISSEFFAGLRPTPRTMFVGGALPISIGGHLYGAVGVSGSRTPSEKLAGTNDEACAKAGIDAVRAVLEFAQ